MPACCFVKGCKSRSNRIGDTVSFYRIPPPELKGKSQKLKTYCAERRKTWLRVLKRGELTENQAKNARICSKHFISGRPAHHYDKKNPDWAPCQNLGYKSSVVLKKAADLARYERSKKREFFIPGIDNYRSPCLPLTGVSTKFPDCPVPKMVDETICLPKIEDSHDFVGLPKSENPHDFVEPPKSEDFHDFMEATITVENVPIYIKEENDPFESQLIYRSDFDHTYFCHEENLYDNLKEQSDILQLPEGWTHFRSLGEVEMIGFSKSIIKSDRGRFIPVNQKSVVLTYNLTIHYSIYGLVANPQILDLPKKVISKVELETVLIDFDRLSLCMGTTILKSDRLSGSMIVDSLSQWRAANCSLVTNQSRCVYCERIYREKKQIQPGQMRKNQETEETTLMAGINKSQHLLEEANSLQEEEN